ncbi:aromatic amino acid ammonia-lyase [Aspergillus mulundensis]|uniref:Phenylalanine ammonia-lyase n=1 Tax=Aspergillus mulundensis TaxID=1810919 RepID=A0A3D8T5I3_9EURO|nr:Phenylalanine ammonia-lyase [Aspergillus mulundensis]RDW93789.1 Phenylalanine ammonia-lyase [Aspergillus mulundensis]
MGEASFCNEHNHAAKMPAHLSEYTAPVLSSFQELEASTKQGQTIQLDGHSLRLSDVIAISKYDAQVTVTDDPEALSRMKDSVALLDTRLAEGRVVYGVNSGFGGNADTRTNAHEDLQKALVQHQNTAVVLPSDKGKECSSIIRSLPSHSIPIPIVKAAMVARCNSLIRGHSAVRIEIVRNLATMINEDYTPVVPLRGSISASGDLAPLSYIAGALEGNSDIYVHCGEKRGNGIVPADKALQELGLEPLTFGPKEALGLLNGTAFSTGAASLVLFEANQLVLLTQVITAMSTEALLGTKRNFDPFIADVRPHPGQKEVAANIYRFLSDSQLITDHDHSASDNDLAQDRYALRTASQWIGPHVENIALALSQVSVELNSTTDNPLFDAANNEIHHGGNFQAMSITTAMEKTTSAIQSLGKLLFGQCSELINPMLSKGLAPNLCADDPSLSFALKGVDINMASYMSELGYLNNPVSNFVQTADVSNQTVNSLALIGARYAADAVEVFSLMVASHIYALCQAVDLREIHKTFEAAARTEAVKVTSDLFGKTLTDAGINALWSEIMRHWNRTATLDLEQRAPTAVSQTMGTLITLLTSKSASVDGNLVAKWQSTVTNILKHHCASNRKAYFANPPTGKLLCSSSAKIYNYVRGTLKVPMHKGLVDHPTYVSDGEDGAGKKTIGTHIGTIYAALREGQFMSVLAECWA